MTMTRPATTSVSGEECSSLMAASSGHREPWNRSTRLPPEHALQHATCTQPSNTVEQTLEPSHHASSDRGSVRTPNVRTKPRGNTKPTLPLPSKKKAHRLAREPSSQRPAYSAVSPISVPPPSITSVAFDAAHHHRALDTRELIERAVETALTDVMRSGECSSSISDLNSSAVAPPRDVSSSSVPAPVVLSADRRDDHDCDRLRTRQQYTEKEDNAWRKHYMQRRHKKEQQETTNRQQGRQRREFARVMTTARYEYEHHKVALHTLLARIESELKFFETTAEELRQRESMLDDAFASYEQLKCEEYGIKVDDSPARRNASAG